MNNIIKQTINFLNILDNSDLIKDLTFYKKELLKDEELIKKINKLNNTEDIIQKMNLKKELYQNKYYQKYMEKYDELTFLILKINKKYNSLLGQRSCSK